MVKSFEEGEVYRNTKIPGALDIMVYATGSEDDSEVVLAVGFVDRESEEMTSPGEITIKKVDFQDWEVVPE